MTVGVLGASGAILCILGVLTVYKPEMKVYLYFMIPVPLWLITVVYAIFSVFGVLAMASGVAHIAHLSGLLIGLIYGYRNKSGYNSIHSEKRLGSNFR
jgi:membrane associated rhomboid family serine protease